ncbi:MAG: DNA repair protein RadC [Burkholderiales bacterium]|nr:DNA repair protein RadC [Burkholderiales bacterium]
MKDIPTALRPREKLLSQGPAALADAELLALLLRTGMKGLGVLQLAEKVLVSAGGLAGLLQASPETLGRIKGLGPAKRSELIAVMELARRSLQTDLQTQPVFGNPQTVKEFLQIQLGNREHEVFGVLFLDAQHRLIAFEELFRGTLSQTSVYPREVVKQALAHNAGAVILAHNHPSGVLEPSRADELLTQTLKSSLNLVDVRVLDHIVVGRSACVSFAERGLL